MKIAYFDCFSGASGDMILGALIDAGFSQERLNEELKKLSVDNYEFDSKKVIRSAITGTKFDVSIKKIQCTMNTTGKEHSKIYPD